VLIVHDYLLSLVQRLCRKTCLPRLVKCQRMMKLDSAFLIRAKAADADSAYTILLGEGRPRVLHQRFR
jgi:hypothetical protein